jgi:hypothetical protein
MMIATNLVLIMIMKNLVIMNKKKKKVINNDNEGGDDIVARIVWRLYKTGWTDNWIYWITHSYTQLQCIHFTTHYSSL